MIQTTIETIQILNCSECNKVLNENNSANYICLPTGEFRRLCLDCAVRCAYYVAWKALDDKEDK